MQNLEFIHTNALVQVGVHVVITVIFGQVNQDSRSTSAVSGPAEAAVADAPAGRAPPLLGGETRHVSFDRHTNYIKLRRSPNCYRIQQGILDLLSVTVAETGAAELTPNPNALRVTTVGLGVNCLLAALVASGSLKIHSKKVFSQKIVARAFIGSKERLTVELLYTFSRTLLQMFCSSVCVMSSTGRTTWGIALAPLKDRRRGWKEKWIAAYEHTHINTDWAFNHLTYWLIIFLIVAAFADQVELVLRLFLWSWAGGSLHQGAGPCVRPGGTWRGPPAGSRGLPRCLAWLLIWYQLLWLYSTRAAKNKLYFSIKVTVVDADTGIRLGKSPGTLFSSAISFAS